MAVSRLDVISEIKQKRLNALTANFCNKKRDELFCKLVIPISMSVKVSEDFYSFVSNNVFQIPAASNPPAMGATINSHN